MRAALIIPSYRRSVDLARCLAACAVMTRQFDELIVVARCDDLGTLAVVRQAMAQSATIRTVTVANAGVIAAMQAGLDAVSSDSDIIALTDDDAAPRPGWLGQIVDYFERQPDLAGVGGRDWLWRNGKVNDVARSEVGKVQWFGRIVGNHHLGVGEPRDVDLLKGVNCAFRAKLLKKIGFDHRLRGGGAQMHWEMAICLLLLRGSWRLLYDPAVEVDHYPAQRADADVNHRGGFHGPSLIDAVHNETLILLEHLFGFGKLAFAFWAVLIGTRENPGIVQIVRLASLRRQNSIARWRAAMLGRWEGWKSYRRYRNAASRQAVDFSGIEMGALKSQ